MYHENSDKGQHWQWLSLGIEKGLNYVCKKKEKKKKIKDDERGRAGNVMREKSKLEEGKPKISGNDNHIN